MPSEVEMCLRVGEKQCRFSAVRVGLSYDRSCAQPAGMVCSMGVTTTLGLAIRYQGMVKNYYPGFDSVFAFHSWDDKRLKSCGRGSRDVAWL